jgi:AcrR family transcriptional regulator
MRKHTRASRAGRPPKEPRASTVALRATVLAAALDRFSSAGIDGTTIQDLQQDTNLSVGSLYHHFGSKEGIAEEVFIDGIQRFNAWVLKKLKACNSAEERVKGAVTFYCDWNMRNRTLARYLRFRNIEFSPAARERLARLYREYLVELYALFDPFIVTGEMRRLPAETYVPIIGGPIEEYFRRWFAGECKMSPAAVKEVFAEAAWGAVSGAPLGAQGSGRSPTSPDGSKT